VSVDGGGVQMEALVSLAVMIRGGVLGSGLVLGSRGPGGVGAISLV